MTVDPEALDAYHARIGVKPRNHPFTAGGGRNGKATSGCVICPMSEGHRVHQGADVINLAQFRQTRGQ